MPPHQSKIVIASGGGAPTTSRRPPMTSKQAKKAYAKATNGPKMSWAERKRIEAAELAAQKKEFERERALARARAARERKEAKEEVARMERRKAGVPEKSRWVRASQGRITGFLGKRGRSEGVDARGEEEEGDDCVNGCEEPVPKRMVPDSEEEDMDDSEDDMDEKRPTVAGSPDGCKEQVLDRVVQDSEDEDMDEERPTVSGSPDGLLTTKALDDIPKDLEDKEAAGREHLVCDFEARALDDIVEDLEDNETDERESLDSDLEARALDDIAEDLDGTEAVERGSLVCEFEARRAPEQMLEVQTEAEAQPGLEVQTELVPQPEPELDAPKLPANNQYLISSQDFLDDDDIFQELVAAHQLLSESFDVGKKPLAAEHHAPEMTTNVLSEHDQTDLSNNTTVHQSQHCLSPAVEAKSIAALQLSSSPKRQPVSLILQQTPQSRIEFACSGVSPELTSSNPFSQHQAALRTMNRPISRPSATATPSVMGPPDIIIRRHATLSALTVSQNKKTPASNTSDSLSQKFARGVGINILSVRRPLKEISRQAQNVQSKNLAASASYSKPFLRPSLMSSNVALKIPPSVLPTSTQLFLTDHLDDFFPSPSQEMRELLEDIEDDDIPSNTQVACELGMDSKKSQSVVMKPAKPILDDDFPWLSSQDLVLSSQELRGIETPSKAPPPPSTPWDVRRARKPRFFVEKEEDLFAAAVYESKLQAKKDEEEARLRWESVRIERELLGTRHSSQRSAQRVTRSNHDVARAKGTADQGSSQLDALEASRQKHLINEFESDDYGDDFDDAEAEASMIAFVDKLENGFAPVEPESESECEFEDEHDELDYGLLDEGDYADDYDYEYYLA